MLKQPAGWLGKEQADSPGVKAAWDNLSPYSTIFSYKPRNSSSSIKF
jgi:hypothetical protein